MFPKLKRGWFVGITSVVILFILNPTYTDFGQFTGLSGTRSKYLHKKANFLICSIYDNSLRDERYLGLLKNFINVTPRRAIAKTEQSNTITTDSSTSVTSIDTNVAVQLSTEDAEIFSDKTAVSTSPQEDLMKIDTEYEPSNKLDLNLKRLYRAMFLNIMFIGSLENFKNEYSNRKAIDKLYENLYKKQIFTKSKERFYKIYFPAFISKR